MPKRRSKLIPKIMAVVLALMIVDALIFWPILFFKWRDSIRSEADYRAAPVCTRPDSDGCRREIASTVKELYTLSSKGATTRYLYLEMPGSELSGRIPI